MAMHVDGKVKISPKQVARIAMEAMLSDYMASPIKPGTDEGTAYFSGTEADKMEVIRHLRIYADRIQKMLGYEQHYSRQGGR